MIYMGDLKVSWKPLTEIQKEVSQKDDQCEANQEMGEASRI